MLADINADVFILDCVPNSTPDRIHNSTDYLVNTIRKRHPETPIVMLQSLVRETGNFNLTSKEYVKNQNIAYREEYDKLIAAGMKELYFIEGDNLIGSDHEGTTDGTHPNDLGFDRMLQVIAPVIAKILNLSVRL
jgi:lysophospholipase L1-like esterase